MKREEEAPVPASTGVGRDDEVVNRPSRGRPRRTPHRRKASSPSPDPVVSFIKDNPTIAISLAILFAGCVKLFSVSRGNLGTALGIIRTTSTVTLLTGTFLSLLPAFVAILISLAAWWWAGSVERGQRGAIVFGLDAPLYLLLLLGVVAFFTVPLLEYIPIALAGATLWGFLAGKAGFPRVPRASTWMSWTMSLLVVVVYVVAYGRMLLSLLTMDIGWIEQGIVLVVAVAIFVCWWLGLRMAKWPIFTEADQATDAADKLKLFALLVAGVVTVTVLLVGNVWLPVEKVALAQDVDVGKFSEIKVDEENALAAYILSQDDKSVTLLTESERAILQLSPGDVAAHQVCVLSPRGLSWLLLYQRPSQIVTHPSFISPYRGCPSA